MSEVTLYGVPMNAGSEKFIVMSNGRIEKFEDKSGGISLYKFRKVNDSNKVFEITAYEDKSEWFANRDGKDYVLYDDSVFTEHYTGNVDISSLFINKNNISFVHSLINQFAKDFLQESNPSIDDVSGVNQLKMQIDEAVAKKPYQFKMKDLKFRLLIRSILRGKNLMITGPTGTGKTTAIKIAKDILKRPYFKIPMGSTQDPRATLIGNTIFDTEKGTIFKKSTFVEAITTPYAMVELDEASRMHAEAENILMSVTDPSQRFLRLDESEDSEVIEVAEGVTFIATANFGGEYTTTRTMDRASLDRWTRLEMDVLDKSQELELLNDLFPNQPEDNERLAELADQIKKDYFCDNPTVETFISTRVLVEVADLIQDGFTFNDAIELIIFPYFDSEGGSSSPRSFLLQIMQKDDVGQVVDDVNEF